jgi:hypothetical protein
LWQLRTIREALNEKLTESKNPVSGDRSMQFQASSRRLEGKSMFR